LILLGFAVIALPLLLGIVNAAFEIRNLASTSERLVLNGMAVAQYTQALVRQVSALERTARLYQIIGRRELLDTFNGNRELLATTLRDFGKLPGSEPERDQVIARMLETTDQIQGRVESGGSVNIVQAVKLFTQLSKDADQLSRIAGAQIDGELKTLRTETERARQRLFLQALALVPVTLVMLVLVGVFLARPIRRIDQAIGNIGHGRLGDPVQIRGPSDLQALGQQLEWLRVRLIEVGEERNRFLRHMSHELKTPLANIREGTELLIEGAVGSLTDDQREVAGILRDNSLQLQRLIENLLSFSEWQTNRRALDVTELRLQPLVKAAIETYQLPIRAHRLRLDLKVDEVSLRADRAKLKLILDNLISNAVKFTPDGGAISMRARLETDGRGIVLDVVDSGPGIPPEERPRIFEAFYQGATPHGSLVRGTGIGLSVVQEFVHAHGGTIEIVDGDLPGAHFRVRIPVKPPASPESGHAARPPEKG
jgi:two-component system sensor histidine kinase GlrK